MRLLRNDYKPINSSLTTTDTRDQLWARLNETHNHKGLYNGNISWMVTDLTKIGEVTNDRSKGIQAMLYKYDQLHRITKSRSLTSYTEGTGFAARSTTPAPYDETYTYDANGNILTLNRMNGEGVLLDDFNYKYYGGTNKLRGVKPITRDTIFNGTINSPDKLYRNITLQGGALAANGNSATLKATELVAMNPSFAAEEGTDFAAYIPEEGPYIYDAIGNLVADEDEGVKISWTPYGKIREVKTNNDSVTVKFRYDGTGNRIEKRVEKYDTTLITRYVRDASGNVMTIYNDTTVSEQPIYGSARLGMYKGSVQDGYQTLGRRSYELSNHLGNVLAVITDNIGMNTQDTVWANVESGGDYYAFGMMMPGRNFSSGSFRYGFNGKEKDDKGELGETHYDYGFRIYNPRIAKFLSVDPLTNKYTYWSPYSAFSNNPVSYIDSDGREPIKPFAGTVNGFIAFFNGLGSGIGNSTRSDAHAAMIRMGSVNWSIKGPAPAATAPFNTSGGNRYIYTEKGGWIDMSHFMFYAGRAYQAKLDKEKAQDLLKEIKKAGIAYSDIPKNLITKSMSDPVSEAVQEGYMQEKMDQYGPTYSAYSYEDLPSDKFGAEFATNHFDTNSNLSFGQQLQNYLNNVLKATSPENAPNYEDLPTEYPEKGALPSVQNRTTNPIYTKD